MKTNPWMGLSPYSEPKEGDNSISFCGRNKATAELTSLIVNNLFVTLYGKTGIGKTSLLQAGVFPYLRKRQYVPIPIRLGLIPDNKKFTEYIIDLITIIIGQDNIKGNNIGPENNEMILRDFFSYSTFFNNKGDVVFPVLTFDQFEEIFISRKAEAWAFMRELHNLLDDTILADEEKGEHSETNFRIVISVREDCLFYLEDVIDKEHLTELKVNRYRLSAMEDKEACSAILDSGKEIIEKKDADAVATKIIGAIKEDGENSSIMLSLICSLLYENLKEGEKINAKKVDNLSSESLKKFYLDVTRHLPITQRDRLEKLLVEGGRRTLNVTYADYKKEVANGDYLFEGKTRILNKGDKKPYFVEIIHDRLAQVIEEVKPTTRLEIYRQRFKNVGYVLAAFFALLLIVWFTYKIPQYFWHDTISLNGPITNTVFETDGGKKPYSVPSGVLNLAKNVRVEHRAFQGHPDIRELHLGDSCNISYFSFQNCPNLTDLYFDGKGIVISSNAFSGCNKIESIIVSDSCDILYLGDQDGFPGLSRIVVNGENSNFRAFGNTLLVKNHLDAKPYWSVICNYTSTQMRRFNHGNGSSSLHIAGEVFLPLMEDSIALDSMKAVYGSTFDISEGETPDTMTYCVLTCNNSYQGTFPKVVQNNPKVIGVDMPYVVHIPNGAFFKNKRLHSAYLPSVYDVGKSAFSNCSSLKNVYLPKASIVQDRAFENCNNLKEIQLPLLEEIDTSCFFGCSSLKTISAPSVKQIHAMAFYLSGLQHAEFPSVEIIESDAFDHCYNLKSLYLPSLRSIDNNFEGCDSLEEIVVPKSIAKKLIYELNKNSEYSSKSRFFEFWREKGKMSILKVVSVPDTTYIVDKDTVDFLDKHSRFCRKLFLSKHVRVINGKPYSFLHRNIGVESGNPVFFSFKNVVYDKDGMRFNANGVKDAYFMNFGIGGGGKYSYEAEFTHDLKTIYLHYPQKKNVHVKVWRSYIEGNTEHTVIDSAFLKTVVLQVPFGYKKYVENMPDYQIFKCVEEISRWGTLLINLDWIVTIRIWSYYNNGSLTMILTIGLLLLVISLFGYVLLFTQKIKLALLLLPIQLLVMFFFAVLLFTIGFNNSYTIGNVDLPATSLMILEIALLFLPWCVLLLRRKTISKNRKK